MPRSCFIIMPYGSTEAQKRHYLGVYESLLAPAAERSGYEPKRSDLGGQPGNITGDIIRDLLDSDMVIADLSGGNANVLFELGIRHVFRKSGTVHVVDASDSIPFDIAAYRAIKYSTDLADIPAAVAEIAKAIKIREETQARSDNPVHDTIPDLPKFIGDIGEAAQRERVAELQGSLERLQRENEKLTARLTELDPAGVLEEMPNSKTVDRLLDEADDAMKSSGKYVMLELMQRINEGGPEAFIVELRKVLKSPYLTDNDFLGLARMCVSLGLDAHRLAVLEVAYNRYPNDYQVALALVDAYDDSPNLALKERGRVMVEQLLQVHRDAKQMPRIGDHAERVKIISNSLGPHFNTAVGLLFNFYFSSRHPQWVLSLCESAAEGGLENVILRRNKARALSDMGRPEDAEREFLEAIDRYPSDTQVLQWFGDMLSDQGRNAEAYEYMERGAIQSPDEPVAYINLGIQVLNRGYARTDSGEIRGPLGENPRIQHALPLFVEAIARSKSGSTRQTVVNILARRDAVAEAEAIAQDMELPGKQSTAALDYILERANSQS